MFKSIPLISNQKDLIHDISFDYYGTRIATSSNDHSINVWDLNDKGTWYCSSNWKAHNGPVWRVIWAHPEFGQVLASCSFDRTVAIWEEITRKVGHGTSNKSSINHNWCKRASLVDSRASVTAIAFAPHAGINTILDLSSSKGNPGIDLGLTLVTASADGMIRFYEAPDVVNLSQWSLSYELTTHPSPNIAGKEVATTKGMQTAIELNLTWSTSKIFLPLLAVGIDGSNDPNCCSKGKIQIYQYADNGKKWSLIEEQLASIAEPVKDIKFAPDVGLSYHVLSCATANAAFIFALKPSESGSSTSTLTNNDPSSINCYKSFLETSATFLPISTPDLKLFQMAQLSAPGHSIWRLSWNITGNVLATSGQDGMVRLWKANFLGQWKCSVALKNDGMVVNGVIPSTGEIDDFKDPGQNYSGLESMQKTTPDDHKLKGKLGGFATTLDSASQAVWH